MDRCQAPPYPLGPVFLPFPLSNTTFREGQHTSLCRAESMRWREERHMPHFPCHQEYPALSAPPGNE